MTERKMRDYYDYEALRGLVAFFLMLFVVAICLDVGYLQAKRFDMQGSINLAAMTAVEALPNAEQARDLAMNVGNSQGMPLLPWDVNVDPNHRWLEVEKTDYYDTMFLKYVGVDRIPIHVYAFDFKPGI